jgi:DNA repair exonuclease SbcCD ATPase subunit
MDTFEMVTNVGGEFGDQKGVTQTTRDQLQRLNVLKDQLERNHEFLQELDIQALKQKINLFQKYIKTSRELVDKGSFKPSLLLAKMKKNITRHRDRLSVVALAETKIGEARDINTLKDEKRDLAIQSNTLFQRLKIKNSLLNKVKVENKYDGDEHSKINQAIKECEEVLKEKRDALEKLKNKEQLENKLESLKAALARLPRLEQLEQLLNQIECDLNHWYKYNEYKNFQVQLKKYKKIKETLVVFTSNKEEAQRTYLKTLLFRQKVIEAEHESLHNVINIINTHLDLLLQDFFSDSFGDPIQIRLELVNQTRPQVNTIINYKGNSVDYKSLSTGEYARVKLAFDLTFKEILGQSIIMLDECTANLDQDLSTHIFDKIRATFPSKTILVVAHQVITGSFDHVLNV